MSISAKIPKNASLEKFLEDNAVKFEGGFRDLDKLACMYFNYRIFKYAAVRRISEDVEKKIVDEIRNDFFSKSQLHTHSENDLTLFQITPGLPFQVLLEQFKLHVKNWGKKKYGTASKAEKALGLGQGTMKNWKIEKG